jgi:hypothetical protein
MTKPNIANDHLKMAKKNTLAGKRRKGKELWTLFEDD